MNQEIVLRSTAGQLSAPLRPNSVVIVGPGRILDKAFLSAGKSFGNVVNNFAHRLGNGPIATTERIRNALGSQTGEIAKTLERLHHYLNGSSGVDDQNVRILTMAFEKLVMYALPTETFSSQLQALKSIVMLVTRYPGLRRLFTRSYHPPPTQESLFASWSRVGESCDSNSQFVFYRKFAAFCLIDNYLASEIEGTLPSQLGCVGAVNNAIEILLAKISTDDSGLESRAALRYLGGILELPFYWIDHSSPHNRVASKAIFERARDILLDLDLDTSVENDSAPPLVLESEAIDIFADAILSGLEIWVGSHPAGPDSDKPSWESACWFPAGKTFIQLLRMPKARKLLPLSSQRTQTDEVRKIYPVAENTTEVLVRRAMVDPSTEGSSMLNAPYETILKSSQLRTDDIVIAIIGTTGSGKSHFMDTLTGEVEKGSRSTSRSKVSGVRIKNHDTYNNRIVLLNTPALDDTRKSCREILQFIRKDILYLRLPRILYLHQITDNRLRGTASDILGGFQGGHAALRVMLVTTMWDQVQPPEVGEIREVDLKRNFWRTEIESDATARFGNTKESAWEIINNVIVIAPLEDSQSRQKLYGINNGDRSASLTTRLRTKFVDWMPNRAAGLPY